MLPEIRLAMRRLRETGQPTLLDLRAAPLGPVDERRLFEALHRGAERRPVRRCGSCRIHETASPCVWIVEHCDSGGEVTAKFIEVCWWPAPLEEKMPLPVDGLPDHAPPRRPGNTRIE